MPIEALEGQIQKAHTKEKLPLDSSMLMLLHFVLLSFEMLLKSFTMYILAPLPFNSFLLFQVKLSKRLAYNISCFPSPLISTALWWSTFILLAALLAWVSWTIPPYRVLSCSINQVINKCMRSLKDKKYWFLTNKMTINIKNNNKI